MNERLKSMNRSVSLFFLNDDEPDSTMMTDVMQRVRDVQSPENQKVIDQVIEDYAKKQEIGLTQEGSKPKFAKRLRDYINGLRK